MGLASAPHIDRLKNFITSDCILVMSLRSGDLLSIVRAAAIDSPNMMKSVSIQEMTEFFLYSREVNSRVAEMRTRETGRLVKIVAVNDLTGVSSFPDKDFQAALTGGSE